MSVMSRRGVVVGGGTGLLASACGTRAAEGIRAIAFDAFPVFDQREIAAFVKTRVPVEGDALMRLWLTKLFASTWLETAAERYQPFETIAAATLQTCAESLGVDLSAADRDEIVASFGRLEAWPDVKPALEKLKTVGVRLALLSNLAESTLRSNIEHAGLTGFFEMVLSTDRVRKFKPSPQAYAMATDAFQLPRSAIGFAAFGGWDAVGATWFGYKTAWINRKGLPPEPFAERPAIVTAGFDGVLQLAGLA